MPSDREGGSGREPSEDRSAGHLLVDQLQHLTGVRMPPQRLLGEDAAAIHIDLEHASRRLDELHFGVRVLLTDLSRQTGSSRFVVSNNAVLDHYPHMR
jgi:hypothetical protein